MPGILAVLFIALCVTANAERSTPNAQCRTLQRFNPSTIQRDEAMRSLNFRDNVLWAVARKMRVDPQTNLLPDFARELATSTIDFNSSTGTLFTVAAHGCAFKDIGLRNTSGSTPSAGAGILVSSGGDRTTYSNLSVDGFYIDIDVQAGSGQKWDGCWIIAPVLYGLKLRNIGVPDAGDHFISNCYVCGGGGRNATSAIRIESGGGVKIVNTKINVIDTATLQNGIDLAVGNSIITVDLLISNCSIEGFSAAGIKATSGAGAQWSCIVITGNQISPFASGNPRGIYFNGTTANDLYDVSITGNVGLATPSSTNSFIDLTNCSNVTIVGNLQRGYGALATIGSGVTFARSAVVPPGGTTGQSLKKLSNAAYDIGWG